MTKKTMYKNFSEQKRPQVNYRLLMYIKTSFEMAEKVSQRIDHR